MGQVLLTAKHFPDRKGSEFWHECTMSNTPCFLVVKGSEQTVSQTIPHVKQCTLVGSFFVIPLVTDAVKNIMAVDNHYTLPHSVVSEYLAINIGYASVACMCVC